MPHNPLCAPKHPGEIAPKLAKPTDQVLFGDVWMRTQLSPRRRSIATVSAPVALGRAAQLPLHLARARDNGPTCAEFAERGTHVAFYAGWLCAFSAAEALRQESAA